MIQNSTSRKYSSEVNMSFIPFDSRQEPPAGKKPCRIWIENFFDGMVPMADEVEVILQIQWKTTGSPGRLGSDVA